ncbi:MAG: ATP-grasp domain-containing protein [Pseudomonadales bacterium]|nr:ATP-grasp domain-containing protein [Pseudomonadales bacterium]
MSNVDENTTAIKSIKRLLIANRGEIACRVIRTCKKLGIESVAVFSDADRHAQHVQQADLAVYIGASSAKESYLNAQSIMDAALKIKADAIHPGYGFLSESTELITLCQSNDVIFIGPSVESIADMGSKIEAKAIAQSLDIPTVPGYNGDNQDSATLKSESEKVGYPLLIKASAGGGGKGMRIVNDASEFDEALTLAKQESLSSFGDDRVLLEKYLVRPRHIEVQVLGDSHGNVVHLFDRECSIQRNYQKVIEEAPVSHLGDELRQKLFDCAVRLGKHLSYLGAGTIEFIVDADTQDAYFLEMNTRLQVEHPTTEFVTGIDLVECQIKVAKGEALAFSQDQITVTGHAIEARLNAEDPANNYMPETGTIELYREPTGEGLRVDSGVSQGSEISPFYDSMVAKVIAYGATRGLAAQRLLKGLNNFSIGGFKTNQEFLIALITRPAFHQELTTQYIAKQFPEGWQPWGEEMHMAIAAAAYAEQGQHDESNMQAGNPWQSKGSWRVTDLSGTPASAWFCIEHGGELIEMSVQGRAGDYRVRVGSDLDEKIAEQYHVMLTRPSESQSEVTYWQVEINNTRVSLDILFSENQKVSLSSPRLNRSYSFVTLEDSLLGPAAELKDNSTSIRAVMPGIVTDVLVKTGDKVEEGETLLVMEAMKLIHNLSAPCSGVVKEILCAAGDSVADGALLIDIDPDETDG